MVSRRVHHRERRADPALVLLPALLQCGPHRPRAVRDSPLARVRLRRERRRVPQERRELHRLPAGGRARGLRHRPLVLYAPESRRQSAVRLRGALRRQAQAPGPLEHLRVLRDVRESRPVRPDRRLRAAARTPGHRPLASFERSSPDPRRARSLRRVRRADGLPEDGGILGRPFDVVRAPEPFSFLEGALRARLARRATTGSPASVHHAEYPSFDAALIDDDLERRMRAARRVVELGRAARASAGVKTRMPLPKLIVVFDANDRDRGALDSDSDLAEIVKDELNVKAIEVRDAAEGLVRETVKPDLKVLGPKLGKDLPRIRQALAEG